jgi:predicted 2-oxoglutarate/Fe(II)-dependent dioxygenase YbiX
MTGLVFLTPRAVYTRVAVRQLAAGLSPFHGRFDLDTAIRRLTLDVPDHPAAVQLTAVYHNLLRRWAEVS